MRPSLAPASQATIAALKCPRCDSANTKFCYYNNYNLSQPRHFCKSCRRYWTNGGILRNVPVGGGCRKPKRPRSSSSSSPRTPKPSSNVQPLIDDRCSSSSAVWKNPMSAPPAGTFASVDESNLLGSSVLVSSQPKTSVIDACDGADEAASLAMELAGIEWPAADPGLMEFSGATEQNNNWGCQNVFQTQTQIPWCELDQIGSYYFP